MQKAKDKTAYKVPDRVLEAFSKVEIHTCSMCGEFLGDKEFKDGEGVCLKHWDY